MTKPTKPDNPIRSFKEFTETFYDNSLSQTIFRIPMLVKKIYSTDSENPLARLIGETRNLLFDQILITASNIDSIIIDKTFPVINFTKEHDILKNLISIGTVKDINLYNSPDSSEYVSDKVNFHQQFSGKDFIPKTVFTIDDTKELQFPIIAKPKDGKSAKGIKKFKSIEELKKSTEVFDVYSEMIDMKNEYRCFCFGEKILELDLRVKLKGALDFLDKSETETEFYYKSIDFEKFEKISELYSVIKESKMITNLDFFSLDFALDKSGKLWVIEINARTGMGVDKMLELYKAIYEDFYGKKVNQITEEKFIELSKIWKETYDKEKHANINECTTVAGKLNNKYYLFKNRDRSFTPENIVIRKKMNDTEVVYYSDQTGWIEGMNEHGVGFVFSMFTKNQAVGYYPSYFISDDPKSETKKEHEEDSDFRKSVKKMIVSKTAKQAVEIYEKTKSDNYGSFLIGDKDEIWEIENYNGKFKKRKLEIEEGETYVKTNHGELIKKAGHQETGTSIKRASTETRKHQAEIQLGTVQNLDDVQKAMKFQAFDSKSSLNVFRTDDEEFTISQCLMSLEDLVFYFYNDEATANSVKIEDTEIKNPKIKIEVVNFTKQS